MYDAQKPSARIIADSVGPHGHRVTTMQVVIHRFVLAELNTHRAFSRNSASSRAIPVAKMIESVFSDVAYPIAWTTEQRGMVGGEPLPEDDSLSAEMVWMQAARETIDRANQLHALGVHKSIINRLLEPFAWHTVIITATEWDNFFKQRCHSDAQPEIRMAAWSMRAALETSVPTELARGEWHLPYLQKDEHNLPIYEKIAICVARCARVSYLTHDGVRDVPSDIRLHERLLNAKPPHASPFEHVAQCAADTRYANLRGWTSQRNWLGI